MGSKKGADPMDSRTELLAAGRKKLQQFRQKKDKGSGSQGKSKNKSGKSEHCTVSTATKTTTSSQVRGGETESAVGSSSGIVNTSEPNSVTSYADSDTSGVPITQDKSVVETELEKNAEAPSKETGVSEIDAHSSVQNEDVTESAVDSTLGIVSTSEPTSVTSHADSDTSGAVAVPITQEKSVVETELEKNGEAPSKETGVSETDALSSFQNEDVTEAAVDSTLGIVSTLEPNSVKSYVDSDTSGAVAVPITLEKSVVETELEKNAEAPSKETEVSETDAHSSVQNEDVTESAVDSTLGIVSTSEPNSVTSHADSDTSGAVAVPITQEKSVVETELEKNGEAPSKETGVSETDAHSSFQNEDATESAVDSTLGIVSTSEPNSVKSYADSDTSGAVAVPITQEKSVVETELEKNAEVPSKEMEVSETDAHSSVQNEDVTASAVDSTLEIVSTSEPNSVTSYADSDTSGAVAVPITQEKSVVETELEQNGEAPSKETGVSETDAHSSVQNEDVTESAVYSTLGIVSTLEPNSVKSYVDSDTSGAVAVPITQEKSVVETELEKNAEAPSKEMEVSETDAHSSVQNEDVTESAVDSTMGIVSTSEPNSVTSYADSDTSGVPITQDKSVVETELEKNAEAPSKETGVSEIDAHSSVQNEDVTESAVDSTLGIVSTSEPNSVMSHADSDTSGAVAVPITQEKSVVETELEKNGEAPSKETGVSDSIGHLTPSKETELEKTDAHSFVQNEDVSAGTAGTELARDISLDTSHIVDSGEVEDSKVSVQVDESTQHVSVNIIEGAFVTVQERDGRKCVNTTLGELKVENEALEEYSKKLEATNIELVVLYEALEEHRGSIESRNCELNSELMARAEEIEELKQRCLDSTALQKLIEDVEGVLKVEHPEFQVDKTPASHLESLVSSLVRKFEEIDVQLGLSKEDSGSSKVVELTLMEEEVLQLNALNLQHESELIVLRESLHQAEEVLLVAHSEIQGKLNELEQSEQRVSSLREKLTIAVTKGKGLIVQRDGLKQSLNEKSLELERISQEMQVKDERLLEIEMKLKAYSESSERVEALESELSYIRNSATALRESFLLKDSVLQRIEEILEDLDLPEHFHSRDIFEKINWLARTATSNTLPVTDLDQKSSGGGGSYPDAGFVVMDPWEDDVQTSSDPSEDIKRKYDELQSKFYGLAEQNEMLEQSLMEKNNIVQRWEELLDRIDMPSHLHSMGPEDRINWLSKALSEVQEDNMSLQQKLVNLENHHASITVDLEDSQRRVSDLEADLQTFIHERNHLSERLETLVHDQEKLSTKATEYELENEKLQKEISDLHENVAKMHENENQFLRIEDDLRRLQRLVTDALEVSGSKYEYSGGSSIECLEGSLNKLLESYATLSSGKPVHGGEAESTDAMVAQSRSLNTLDSEESDIDVLKKQLEEVQHELLDVKDERDGYIEKQQSVANEFEALHDRVNELQGLLSQEEHKSALVREKLNVAVRKGKSLVQQRDSLKQSIDEVNSEVERLRADIKMGQVKIAGYEQNLYPGRVEALESETLFLRNCLNETEQNLQQKANTLSMIVNIIDNIGVGGDFNSPDPVVKLEQIGNMCFVLSTNIASSEQEARKSKRAAELLLAELNEVQERNDALQEELVKSADEISMLSKERDLAEAGKLEAVLSLEKLSTAHSEERKNQFSEFARLKSGVDQLRKGFHDISDSLAGLFHNNLEFLNNLESGIDSCLNLNSASVVDVRPFSAVGGLLASRSDENFISNGGQFGDNFFIETFTYIAHHVQELMTDICVLKEKLAEHSMSLHEKTSSVSRLVAVVHGEITSKKESFEALRRDFLQMEMVKKEKDKELLVLHRNAALLFGACSSSVVEINRRKAELVGNSWVVGDMGINSKTVELPAFSGEGQSFSEECVRSVADGLLSAATDFATLTAEIVEGSQKEMKLTISNLQKELQEKDVQRERIFMELVSQIKEAEATASSYSVDLESSKTLVHDLEKHLEAMVVERNLFEQRVKELEDGHATSDELQQRVRSLTDVLATKGLEIEELMQALDEEEVQMQGMTYKIKELEKTVEQKNLDLENLEASRGKVLKKLSITVNKFDELHYLSASLLSEVGKLQSQLQDRDAEISFLRQEVTRCTTDVLAASQVSNKGNSYEIHELLTWIDMNLARVGLPSEYLEDKNNGDIPEQKELLKKKVDYVLSELANLRAAARSKDVLLQEERTKVEELTHKGQTLEKSLREKESRLNLLEGVEDGRTTSSSSEIREVEPAINKWAASGSSIASQVRSLRKGNSEQVAIAIDMDPESTSGLEDEEDDKVHGFKSLTTSRMIPRFTRPVTDMVDGLWVTCDRTLMRQPILRLGIIFYWAFLHTLLASLAI